MSLLPVIGGKIIGTPYQGSHKPGATTPPSWQSDNAVDISVPVGTPVYAVHDGVVGPNIGPFSSMSPYLAGQRLTVSWAGNAAYYAHLSKILVHSGEQVKAGQLLGYSGSANGVAHLHWALEKGNPLDWLKGLAASAKAAVTGGQTGSATSTASPQGCATSSVLFVISILGGFEVVKYFL